LTFGSVLLRTGRRQVPDCGVRSPGCSAIVIITSRIRDVIRGMHSGDLPDMPASQNLR
jgi:hypothetical protein